MAGASSCWAALSPAFSFVKWTFNLGLPASSPPVFNCKQISFVTNPQSNRLYMYMRFYREWCITLVRPHPSTWQKWIIFLSKVKHLTPLLLVQRTCLSKIFKVNKTVLRNGVQQEWSRHPSSKVKPDLLAKCTSWAPLPLMRRRNSREE